MSDDIEWTIDAEGWFRPPRRADAMSDDIVKRLRGRYAVGPIQENGEPEFGWREFAPAPAIQIEAADEIERLRKEVRALGVTWSIGEG